VPPLSHRKECASRRNERGWVHPVAGKSVQETENEEVEGRRRLHTWQGRGELREFRETKVDTPTLCCNCAEAIERRTVESDFESAVCAKSAQVLEGKRVVCEDENKVFTCESAGEWLGRQRSGQEGN
jgi:hypothetical protein